MATLRSSGNSYNVGSAPPTVTWTVVRGDTAAFGVYLTDDSQQPLNIPAWQIAMKIKRPSVSRDPVEITDSATVILSLTPSPADDDSNGQFTVSLTSSESLTLETGDIFDIQVSNSETLQVWTVAQGSMIILEDVTD